MLWKVLKNGLNRACHPEYSKWRTQKDRRSTSKLEHRKKLKGRYISLISWSPMEDFGERPAYKIKRQA